MAEIGQNLSHYSITGKIGKGGMGEVFRAKDQRLGRDVAIKVLPEEFAKDADRVARFQREAKLLASLNHPNIATIYGLEESAGTNFLVLELIEGDTLADRIKAGPIPVEESLKLALQIAEALEAAHEKGVIHRDLKPSNIKVTPEGKVKVLDFGLAKQSIPAGQTESQGETLSAITQSGMIAGTIPYMSPEQLEGKPTDSRSDLFSFGTILYEMLTRVHPFSRTSAMETASAILTKTPPPLDRHKQGIPGQLQGIVGKLLAKNLLQRYQSAHHVHADLIQILPGGAAAPKGWRSFRLVWVAVLVIIVVFGIIPLGWWIRNSFIESPQAALAFHARDWALISDFENLTGDSVFDKSLATALNASLSQSAYANIFSKSRSNAVLQRMGKKPDTLVNQQIGCEICQRENIRGLICPTIGKVGNRFVLSAKIVDPQTGDEVRSYVEQADGYNQVLPALDRIAAALRKGLGESLPQIETRSRPLAQVTTSSLTALKAYSNGLQLWEKGQYGAALDLLLTATKEDPDFAMAHAAIGRFYSSYIFNDFTNSRLHYESALKLVDRLTEREKQVIRLQYESDFGKYETAHNLYEIFLRDYPDSIPQRYNYGIVLRDHNMVDKAIEQFKEVLRIAPDYAAAYINLATCYSKINRPRDALESYNRAFKLEPDWLMDGNQNREYGLVFVELGDIVKRVRCIQRFSRQKSVPWRCVRWRCSTSTRENTRTQSISWRSRFSCVFPERTC
jgi:serine/threonine protein kinase/tetratricopeptide (TPR) repeat protein